MEPTLKNKKFDDALLHAGVNDLLNDENHDSVQNLLDNLRQIGLKCKLAGVKRTLISEIVVNNKLKSTYISSINQFIFNMRRDLPTHYKNPGNPSYIDLFLINRPNTFQCTTTIETSSSDFRKLVVTVLKTFSKKQRSKIIH